MRDSKLQLCTLKNLFKLKFSTIPTNRDKERPYIGISDTISQAFNLATLTFFYRPTLIAQYRGESTAIEEVYLTAETRVMAVAAVESSMRMF